MSDDNCNPLAGADAVHEAIRSFGEDLARLRELHGNPSFDRMHSAIRHRVGVVGSKNTFHRMINNPDRIYGPEFVRGFILALGLNDDAVGEWEQRRLRALEHYQVSRDTAVMPDCQDEPSVQNRRSYRRLIVPLAVIAAVTLIVILALTGFMGRGNRSAPNAHAVTGDTRRSAVSRVMSPRDGADPEDSGCSLDPGVTMLDSAEVDYDGAPAGLDELIYSPLCGVAWARFQPFPKAQIPTDAIIYVYVIRPSSGNLSLSFHAPYVGAPVYGNVLHNTQYCVYAAVAIEDRGDKLPASRTRCFRGKTPVE